MVFSSLVFMFAYLPITLLAYYLVPRQGRNIFLFIVNLIFYGWGEPKLVLLMVFNIFFNYIGGWLVDKYRADAKKKKLFLILTCVLDIGILAVSICCRFSIFRSFKSACRSASASTHSRQ